MPLPFWHDWRVECNARMQLTPPSTGSPRPSATVIAILRKTSCRPAANEGNTMGHTNDAVDAEVKSALSEVEPDSSYKGLRRVLTYGTFDLLHYGHIRLLRRAAQMGDYLIVALSTDEFNAGKGKKSFYPYEVRREMLEAIRYVDLVIPEYSWEQKVDDIKKYGIDVVVMGGDWAGSDRFEYLRDYCELVFLDRTPGISTTQVKQHLHKGV